jgi:hypothetical protein
VTPAEFTAAVREMAAIAPPVRGAMRVVDRKPTDGRAPYRYAMLTMSGADWRERIVGLVELATRIEGYVTVHCYPGTKVVRVAISRDLTPDEIAALPDSSRDVPLEDVIGEVAGG